MEAVRTPDDAITVSMSIAEAVVVHELIAFSEFEGDLEIIELSKPVAQRVMSEVQQALAPLIPTLGTDDYGSTVERAYAEIDPRPYGPG